MNCCTFIRALVFALFPTCLLGMEHAASPWIQEALHAQQSGAWLVQDKMGKTVLVEGELISPVNHRVITSDVDIKNLATMFADVMEPVSNVLHKTYAATRIYSKIQDLYRWKSHRDRMYDECVEEIGKLKLQQGDEPAYIFTVSELLADGSKSLMGAGIFVVHKEYAYGTVELNLLSVKPEAQGRGLSTILASSILKFLSQTKRIVLDAACTNRKAHGVYEVIGFKRYENKHEDLNCFSRLLRSYEVYYEYLLGSPTCQKLQTCAAMFKEIKN